MRYKPFVCALALLALLLVGCASEAPVEPTAVPTAVPTAMPIYTPSPSPTPTPEPTPTPTPSPRPTAYLGDAEREHLFLDAETVPLRHSRLSKLRIYDELPEEESSGELIDKYAIRGEMLVLGEEIAPNGTLYSRVRLCYNGQEGYVESEWLRLPKMTLQETPTYALMQRPGCGIYAEPNMEKALVAREDYHAVRILGEEKGFVFVVTQDGNAGYMDPEQLKVIAREQLEEYLLSGQIADSAEEFSLDAFTDRIEQLVGTSAESIEQLIVSELTRAGLFFSPGYYTYLEKPLGNIEFYPQQLYQQEVYNSLLFKLWNSAGDLVLANGEETEWAYIDDYMDVERGDLLFFSAYEEGDVETVEHYEVVLRGRASGYITSCGVYLGDDRMLTVENGQVTVTESVCDSGLLEWFDSARRIHASVTDEKAHLIETLISAIYDRLGTPYNNFARTGDRSYDCSGIVCWALRTMEIWRVPSDRGREMEETTAAGLSNSYTFYRAGEKLTLAPLSEEPQVFEDIEKLERGDLVFLRNDKHSRVGHIMVYLGNDLVIHSTTVSKNYRGTLVAKFREELKGLYSTASRIVSIEPTE